MALNDDHPRADLNPFLKPMVSKPMQEAVEKISEILARLPYEEQDLTP